jgi:hypothetical protein
VSRAAGWSPLIIIHITNPPPPTASAIRPQRASPTNRRTKRGLSFHCTGGQALHNAALEDQYQHH